jgi:Domain of unknown function (DUF4431)
MMKGVRFLLALAAATLSAQTVCVDYEPSAVHPAGRIERRTYPGPPNYTSIEGGDARDVQWILILSRAVCVNGIPGDQLNGGSESNVTEVQLVITDARDWKRYAPLVGKDVQVTGTLFHGHTAHHRTQVLITVRRIEDRFKKVRAIKPESIFRRLLRVVHDEDVDRSLCRLQSEPQLFAERGE